MSWLLSVFIGATVFGVGITTIDLLGLLGGEDDGEGDAGEDGADLDADDGGGDADADADYGGDDSDAVSEGDESDSDDAEDHVSVVGHDRRHRTNPVLRILSALRNIVYFSLGFGPTGWFALGTGETVPAALLWSGGVGIVVLAGARLLRRILRSELTSEIQDADLLTEHGQVTVTVNPNELGRVRVQVGGAFVDRYARSRSNRPLPPGTRVTVVEVTEESIIVESEEEVAE